MQRPKQWAATRDCPAQQHPAAPKQVQEQGDFRENRCRKNRQLRLFARKGDPDYSFRRLASHFSRIAWLGGSISVKAIPIPELGLE